MHPHYQRRLQAALSYIEEHLTDNPSLEDVAASCHFSEFHFHRIFSALMKETLNSYIARRRMELAANYLAFHPKLSITDIALECGFSSGANFAKAFKQHFGYTPSEIRKPSDEHARKIGKLHSKYGKAFNPADLYPGRTHQHGQETSTMNVRIMRLEEQNLCTLASAEGYAAASLFATWDKLIQWGETHGIAENAQQRYALCYDNPVVTPLEKCRYQAALVVAKDCLPQAPFQQNTLPGGQYASLYYKGPPHSSEAQLSLYSEWLPDSGYEPDHYPMLEHYLNDVRKDGYVEMEILVKLKGL